MMEQAQQHLQAGELDKAETLYRQVIAENPSAAEAMFMLAQVRQQQNDSEEAVELLNRAEQLEPFNPNILHALGVLHINRKAPEDAERAFRKALDINPTHGAARSGLAFLELAAGRFEAARHSAEQVLADEPENAQAMTYLGTALLELGEPSQAQALLQEALRLQPEALTAQAQLGRAFLATGNAAFAAQCFENALQTAPDSADLLEYLGRAQLAMGETLQALEPLRAAVAKGRANAELFRALAACEVAAGNPGQAEGLLAAALSMEPGREDLVVPLAELLIARGATKGAIEQLSALTEEGIDSEPVAILLSRAHTREGNAAAAIAVLEARTESATASEELTLALVQALDSDGQSELAREKLDALLSAEKPSLGTRLYEAHRLLAVDDETAITLLEALAVSAGLTQQQLINIRRMLADALHRVGRYPEAAGQFHAMAHRQAEILLIDAEFDDDEAEAASTAMRKSVTADWPETTADSDRANPVFVISWPGSGHERILPALAAHSQVTLVMDTGPTQASRRALIDRPRGATELARLDDTQCQLRRSRYWKSLQQMGVEANGRQVLDAMWLTAEALPTIARLFPGAHVLFLHRDPRDMTVSWMRSGYRNLDLMAQAYRQQLALVEKCQESLPLNFLALDYDALAEDPEAGLKAALESLDLTMESAVQERFMAVEMPVEVAKGDYAHYRFDPESEEGESPGSDAVH